MTLNLLDLSLPVHPATGLTALGWRADGRPVWPILGGAEGDDGEDDDGADDGSGDDGADGEDDDDKPLGPPGQKALEAEKAKRRSAQAELRKYKASGLTPDEIAALRKTDGDPDAERIRREAETAATKRVNERILRTEIKAAAVGKLADPADAYKFLDLTQFEVDDDGNVDETEIAEAIDQLVDDKPYLKAAQGGGKRFQGAGDGGPRGDGRKAQLAEADLARMSPAEINAARKDGRLDRLLGKS